MPLHLVGASRQWAAGPQHDRVPRTEGKGGRESPPGSGTDDPGRRQRMIEWLRERERDLSRRGGQARTRLGARVLKRSVSADDAGDSANTRSAIAAVRRAIRPSCAL
jgi:hypothetical protein